MSDELVMEQEQQGFTIDSDGKAEWALGKIKEAQEERDRLLNLIAEKQAELDEAKEKAMRRYEQDTEYLKYLLSSYMDTVRCRETKTQRTYQLLSGKLIRKKPTVSFVQDDAALAAWLTETGREDLLKVSPKWGEVKKMLKGDPESGAVIVEETGELVNGVVAVADPEKFDIKIN